MTTGEASAAPAGTLHMVNGACRYVARVGRCYSGFVESKSNIMTISLTLFISKLFCDITETADSSSITRLCFSTAFGELHLPHAQIILPFVPHISEGSFSVSCLRM